MVWVHKTCRSGTGRYCSSGCRLHHNLELARLESEERIHFVNQCYGDGLLCGLFTNSRDLIRSPPHARDQFELGIMDGHRVRRAADCLID